MPNVISVLLFILLIGGIIYGYSQDYKKDKTGISKGLKQGLKIILLIISFYLLRKFYYTYIPVYQNFGTDYNQERLELGIPLLGEDWKEQPWRSSQFSKFYASPKGDQITGHGYKMINHNLWTAVSEEDFFRNPKSKKGLIKKSGYSKGDVSYFLIEPVRVDSDIEHFPDEFLMDFENGIRIPITKTRFDKIIEQWATQ